MYLLVFSSLVLAGITMGQPTTNATCDPTFQWSFNSLKQSPCLVAAYLGSVCDQGVFVVPALPDRGFYQGPTLAQANACGCSSVFYSLLSACAECQSRQNLLTWSQFKGNCTTVYPQFFAGTIPAGTAVPHWAYQNVTDAIFNITLAQTQLNAPESTANPNPTGTNLPSNTSGVSSHKKSNAGPIAGGVVGGVVFLALVCMTAFWFIRRRRGAGPSNLAQTPMGYHDTGEITPFSSALQTPKLYNPADPSTFPSSSSSAMYSSVRVQSPLYTGNTLTDAPRTTQYSGAPEV
ncbi:hypothetical protein DFH09DRAFT_110975 [Mycena vulgaris]|nr:hypothetical protein DFH09DRAFT_110975 [Mycena vulgaris]